MARSHFSTRIFALLSLSIGITQLNCACGAKCSEEINVSSRNDDVADFWTQETVDTVEFGDAVLQNIPGWSGVLGYVLITAAQKTLSTDSAEFKAIEKFTEIVQFNETINRLDQVSDRVKFKILASDYNNLVETNLLHLRYSSKFMLADIGTPQQIPTFQAVLTLCRQYLPWRLMANMRRMVETCTYAIRGKRFADIYFTAKREMRNIIFGTHGRKVLQSANLRRSCLLELAYKDKNCPRASLYDVVAALREHSVELVMYGYMCATLEYGENGIYSSDFRQVVEHARETNVQMLKWIDKRLKKAWTDDMPKKAEAILRRSATKRRSQYFGFEQQRIPKESYQKVAERIKESMDLMGPREQRHNVFLVGLSLSSTSEYATEFPSVRYVHGGHYSFRFSVKNVEGVDILVSRYRLWDEYRARDSFELVSRRLSEVQKLVDDSRYILAKADRLSEISTRHFYHYAYRSRVQIYIQTRDKSRNQTCQSISERSEFVFTTGTIASPLCADGKCSTHYEVDSPPAVREFLYSNEIRCSYLLLFL